MCSIVEQYTCGHEVTVRTSKKVYRDSQIYSNHRQFQLKSAPKTNFLTTLFRSTPISKPRYKMKNEFCPGCQDKDKSLRIQKAQQGPPYDFADVRARQTLRAKNAIGAGKGYFLCTRCTREGRLIAYGAQRAANNGLCCDNGRKEWEAYEKLARSGRSSLSSNVSLPSHSNSTSARTKPSPTCAHARRAADQAAQGYGWSREQALPDCSNATQETREVVAVGFSPERARLRPKNRDSVHLEPKLARDFGSLPGYFPTQRTEPRTCYREPGIDFDRWASNPRTNHGLYPAPGPAPQTALPPTPPQSKDRDRNLISRKPLPQTPQRQTRTESQDPRARPLPQTPKEQTGTASQTPQAPPRQHHPSSSRYGRQPRHITPTATRALRSMKGKEWHDSIELASRSPTTPTPPTHPHRLTSPFHQPMMLSEDITSVSRIRDEEFRMKALSFGGHSSSSRAKMPGRQRMPSPGAVSRIDSQINDMLRYWEG